jgi:hypothetical protein
VGEVGEVVKWVEVEVEVEVEVKLSPPNHRTKSWTGAG